MLDREACRLREMAAADLPMVLTWRNADHVRVNMHHDQIIEPEEHRKWFARVSACSRSLYQVFEYRGVPQGLIYFTDMDIPSKKAELGFYLGAAEPPVGVGATLEYLALEHAFETLGLEQLCCEVLSYNRKVVSMHKRFGFTLQGSRPGPRGPGEEVSVVLLSIARAHWQDKKAPLAKLLFRSAARKV